ncbi:MAG: helix-turn-helix domain-containing protein [Propionibacteriaceae bacterium]|nr:helix-turn-helix domain-containing protein [Propionibacteriaceae bacterium]
MPAKRSYADHGDACAAAHAMELIGDRWTHPVLRELMLAPKRFGELEASVRGITPAVLTARLRELEASGLVRKVVLPPPARVAAYELTAWARQLQPIFEDLARWAHGSPTWEPVGKGLTPDGAVQSMLTMAPAIALDPPLALTLHLHDARIPGDEGYSYALTWGDRLTIERGNAGGAASVTGDATAWIGVLYQGAPLDLVQVEGNADAVRRLVATYADPINGRAS